MFKVHIIDAGHGDCIFLECENTRILIDCGPKKMKTRNAVISTLENIMGDNKKIDIAIVTHNDDDHIGGFKYLLQKDIKIEKIIFNSLNDIPDIIRSSIPQISFNQDNALRKQLLENKLILVETLTRLDAPIIINNIKIDPITPTLEALEVMHRAYEAGEIKKGEKESEPTQISSNQKFEATLNECLSKIKNENDYFIGDTSKPNKASIAFVVEYKKFRGLFLGDAHANDIIEGIKFKGYENLNFDVTKLSHHGSEKNTNSELLNIIGKTEYIICADKSKHNHPNAQTIARILSYDSTPKLHFSTKKNKLSKLINQIDSFNSSIALTFSLNNLNTIIYEYE